MRKRRLFEIGKALFAVPFIIVFSLTRIVLTEPRAQPIHTALWSNLFGQITAGNIQTIVFSVKSIGLIILFGLLYGRFISRFFEEISPYVFIRVGNRQKWVLRKIISLWGISTLFTLFALATELLIAAMKTKDYGMDSGVVTVLLVLLFTLSSLYTSVCLLINMISIQKGVPIGLVLAFCVVLLLELLAIRFYDSPANIFLNPMCFNSEIIADTQSAFLKAGIAVLYLVILSFCTAKYVNIIDIF